MKSKFGRGSLLLLAFSLLIIYASAVSPVSASPSVTQFNPASGPVGTTVQLSATGFSPLDNTCNIRFLNHVKWSPVAGCVVTPTPGGLSAEASESIVIGNNPPGPYTMELTAWVSGSSTIETAGPAAFTVLPPSPSIQFTPSSGQDGAYVMVTGTNFNPLDGVCYIGSGVPVIEPGSESCSVSRGALTGSFTIASTAKAATYVIVATGATGDKGWADFTVTQSTTGPSGGQATVTFTDASTGTNTGSPGDTVTLSGSGFGPMMVLPCTIAGNGLTVDSPVCHYNDGRVSGSFVVDAATPSGTYDVTVTSQNGASASAPFTVTSSGQQSNCDPTDPNSPCYTGSGNGQTSSASITLTPASGPDGTIVAVSGNGFDSQDSTCQIQSVYTDGTPVQIVGSPTCSTDGQGDVTGSFTVASNNQPGSYDIVVVGDQGDYGDAPFTVTPLTTTTATTTAYQTSIFAATGTVTSTSTQTSTIATVTTLSSTAPIIPGVDPSMNPVVLLIFAIVAACVGSGVAYAFMSHSKNRAVEGE